MTPSASSAASVVGSPQPHESAHLHVSGRAPYTDDLPELAGTLHAAFGLSPVPHGRLRSIDLERLQSQPGVVAVFTAAHIPGENNIGPLVHDDPLLAQDTLRYRGQPVFLVVAQTRTQAREAAALAPQVIDVEPLTACMDAMAAHAAGDHVVPSMHLHRGDASQALSTAPHRLQGTFHLGGQEQFYLEGQIAYAIPQESDGLLMHSSTQHPSEMQQLIAHLLQCPAHGVQVLCRRMGGAFGGKESQSAAFACAAALAAKHLHRPVKLRPDRDDDFRITGRRHAFEVAYDVGFDPDGRLLAVEADLISNAGHSADLSAPVMSRALCHFDNAYWLPNVALHGHSARTNTQSNTAFRGFGGPQGALAIEVILDHVARHLGRDALEVQRLNLYGIGERDVTPYGQRVEHNLLPALIEQLVRDSDYHRRRVDITAFNAGQPVLRKGLALTPVKFGISFNVTHLNQAGALVHVYTDGSVLVNHGGTEMGQGLNTKVAQVVAEELGLPLSRVRVSATDTTKIANTSATAASTGSDLNGKAAQMAARQIRQRLAAVAARHLNKPTHAVTFEAGRVKTHDTEGVDWQVLVEIAYRERVQLWSDGFYTTPGLHWDRQTLQGHPFYYFVYGAAVSEVVLDTLTGDWRLLRADVLHDVGRSINPAIDQGQIEGAFIQGMGWLTMEELVWHPADGGPRSGELLTHAPSTYKIPTAHDIPEVLNVQLYGVPNGVDSLHKSKAVGEPPLLLPFSVFLALQDAVSSCGTGPASLSAPATAEALLDAVEIAAGPLPP